MKLFFVRLFFAFLGLCALIFAFEFAKAFSHLLLANHISLFFFTSLIFAVTSLGAAMLAFYVMRNTPKLKPKQRLAYALAYTFMLLPAIVTTLALNHAKTDSIALLHKTQVTLK